MDSDWTNKEVGRGRGEAGLGSRKEMERGGQRLEERRSGGGAQARGGNWWRGRRGPRQKRAAIGGEAERGRGIGEMGVASAGLTYLVQ